MKKSLFFLLFSMIFCSCSNNSTVNKNPNIPNYPFSIDLNLSLPSYSSLKFAANAVFVPDFGAKGVYVFNTGSGYNAFDAACPNQPISSCTALSLNGINLVCPCDKVEYSLFTGLGKLPYPLKQYRVEVNGSTLRVSN